MTPADRMRRPTLGEQGKMRHENRMGAPLWVFLAWNTTRRPGKRDKANPTTPGNSRLPEDTRFGCLSHGRRRCSSGVEQLIRNEQVVGSNPTSGSIFRGFPGNSNAWNNPGESLGLHQSLGDGSIFRFFVYLVYPH